MPLRLALRVSLVFGCDLLIILAFFCVSSLLLNSRSTHFGGAVTKYRLHDVLCSDQQDDDRWLCSDDLDHDEVTTVMTCVFGVYPRGTLE